MSADHIYHLTPEDDLAGLRERLKRTQAQTAILVVPDNAPLLRHIANVKLLSRYADQADMQVVIVTRDAATGDMARRQGFAVYSALDKVPRRRSGGLSKAELAGIPALPRVPFYRYLVKLGCLGLALVVLAAGAALVAGVAVFYAPQATITLAASSETLSTTVNLLASAQIRVISASKGQLPARPVQVLIEEVGQAVTTGLKRAPDAAATGTVVFANRTAGTLTIPVSTTVRTASGVSIRFRTEEEAAAPPGASVRVPVKAVEAGSTGNVKAGTISIVEGTMSFQLNVLNDQDLTGGTEKQVRIVTMEDRNNLRDEIVQRMQASSLTALRKAIRPDDVLPAETLTLVVNEASFDKAPAAEGDYVSARVRATVSGLVLDGEHLKTIVAVRLDDQVPGGFVFLPQTITYGAPANVTFSDGVISLQISATARSRARIGTVEVKRAAAGKMRLDAERDIARLFPLAQPPQIVLQRGWLGRMPVLTARIAVIIE